VTGGSGIVGQPLVRLLVSQGHDVTVLCRNPKTDNSAKVRWITGDVGDPKLGLSTEVWNDLCENVDTIFHLAARTDFKGKSIQDYSKVNVEGVRHVKELALRANAWMHHVSTAFVCGEWEGNFSEGQLRDGQRFHNFYEESKSLGEMVLREEPAPKYTVYRPSIILERTPTVASTSVFGPLVFLDGVFRLCLGSIKRNQDLTTIRVAGNAKSHLPFVFDDEVAAVLASLFKNHAVHGKTYHLVPASPFSNRILEQVFNQAFSRKAVEWVDSDILSKCELSTAEKILSKKTKMYTPYLDLNTVFLRENLEDALGTKVLPALAEEALLTTFSTFLASKKELQKVVSYDEKFHLDSYFKHFLVKHTGKPLIKNLASLSANFHIEIKGYMTWVITIEKGVLTKVEEGSSGDFGYCTDGKSFLDIASGKISPQKGFFQGAIQLKNNPKEALRTATALEEFFHEYPYIS
jgi:nucleoside-diphosphate-sugar epimerase/putative sterol carrier protein